ncbi:hypothetical protein GGI12_003974 [Dipsacomyces acuminosporus]|nr:hypothetical protein GGI12_003974 [Dipsacomyces acuminosporus]
MCDIEIISAAHRQTRSEFEANRSLSDEKKIKKSLKHAANVEEVIRKYVVQGLKNEEKTSTYNIAFTPEHALRDAHPIIIKSTLAKNTPASKDTEQA